MRDKLRGVICPLELPKGPGGAGGLPEHHPSLASACPLPRTTQLSPGDTCTVASLCLGSASGSI